MPTKCPRIRLASSPILSTDVGQKQMKRLIILLLLTTSGCTTLSDRTGNQDVADNLRCILTLNSVLNETRRGVYHPTLAWIYNVGPTPICCSLEPIAEWFVIENGEQQLIHKSTAHPLLPVPWRLLKPSMHLYDRMNIGHARQVVFFHGAETTFTNEDVGHFVFEFPATDPVTVANHIYLLKLTFQIFRNDRYYSISLTRDVDGSVLAKRLANKQIQATGVPPAPDL